MGDYTHPSYLYSLDDFIALSRELSCGSDFTLRKVKALIVGADD